MLKKLCILMVIPLVIMSLCLVGYAAYESDEDPAKAPPMKDISRKADPRLEFC